MNYSFDLSGDDSLWGPNMMMLAPISHFLLTFSSSINFAIYCIKVITQQNHTDNVVLIKIFSLQDKKFRGHCLNAVSLGLIQWRQDRRVSDMELDTIMDTNITQPCRTASSAVQSVLV